MVGELCVLPQVVQDLGPQLAVLFPHGTALSPRQADSWAVVSIFFSFHVFTVSCAFSPHVDGCSALSAPAGNQQPSLIALYGYHK